MEQWRRELVLTNTPPGTISICWRSHNEYWQCHECYYMADESILRLENRIVKVEPEDYLVRAEMN